MILVVGGSRGLGYAIANQYSKKYKVIVLSRFQNLKKKIYLLKNAILIMKKI